MVCGEKSSRLAKSSDLSWMVRVNYTPTISQLKDLKMYLIKHRSYFNKETSQVDFLDVAIKPVLKSVDISCDEEGKDAYGTVAYDTLAIWLSRATQVIHQNKSNTKITNDISHLITPEMMVHFYHQVIALWSDSGSPLSNALNAMFSKLITFIRTSRSDQFKKEIFEKWMLETLQMPPSTRVFYFLIDQLYKEVEPHEYILDHCPGFVGLALGYIWSTSLSTSIGRVLSNVLKHAHVAEDEEKWMSLWQENAIEGLKTPKLRHGMQTYFFPHLFQISKSATTKFLGLVSQQCDTSTLFGCLTIAQNTSVILEPFEGDDAIISLHEVGQLLTTENEYFKVSALKLLVTTPKLASPINPEIYHIVENCMDAFFSETDIEIRYKVFSILKRFIFRIRDSTYRLDRDMKKLSIKNSVKFDIEIKEKKRSIESGQQFLRKLLEVTLFNLKPGSSHQRKAFAFPCLITLITSGLDKSTKSTFHDKQKRVDYPFNISIYNNDLLRIMIDNIADNYEDNRRNAVEVLSMSPIDIPPQFLHLASKRSMKLLHSMRGKAIDSGARYFCFIFKLYMQLKQYSQCVSLLEMIKDKLDEGLSLAETDFATACFKYSVHGYFLVFQLILDVLDFSKFKDSLFMRKLPTALIESAIREWKITSQILQRDSPEGCLPEELRRNYNSKLEQKFGNGSQVSLSYSWRTLKESSGMLNSMLLHSPLSDEEVNKIGPLLISQLSTIRHRGAFSSVYPTFVSCCIRCKKTPSLNHLNKEWLTDSMNIISAESHFITRRSAGIPYLITGVLTSNPEYTENTMEKLLSVANIPDEIEPTLEDVNLPQVNAFNCLKAIYTDKALAAQSIKYVSEGMKLALLSFESPIWAIRNCAVMLFTALQNRLFSSRKLHNNYSSTYPAKVFFSKFSSIKQIFLENLNGIDDSKSQNRLAQVERIFPILTLMGQLESTQEDAGLSAFHPLILHWLYCRQWKVREMAARSLPAILTGKSSLRAEFHNQMETLAASKDDMNTAHGCLLASIELVKDIRKDDGNLKSFDVGKKDQEYITELLESVESEVFSMSNFVLSIKCYSIQLEFFKLLYTFDDLNKHSEVLNIIERWFTAHLKFETKLDGSRKLAIEAACKLLLKATVGKVDGNIKFEDVFSESLNSNLYRVELGALSYCKENSKLLTELQTRDIINILWKMVFGGNWVYVKSHCLDLLNLLSTVQRVSSNIDNKDLSKRISILFELYTNNSNKLLKLSCIEVLGPLVAVSMVGNSNSVSDLYKRWIGSIKTLDRDNQEFPERSAALKSLTGFLMIVSHSKLIEFSTQQYKAQILEVICLLFKYLSDDDLELRCRASEYLSKLILGVDSTLIPTMAEKLVAKWMISLLEKYPEFISILFQNSSFIFFNSSTRFNRLFVDNELLFNSERMNLFSDDTRRADEFFHVIKSLKEYSTCAEYHSFAKIVRRNVEDVVEWINTGNHIDGCLGWSSDEDIFQFIYENIQYLKAISDEDPLLKQVAKLFTRPDLQIHPSLVKLVVTE